MPKTYDINDLCISLDDTLLAAIKHMDQWGYKLLIVTKDDRFHSLVSIGDIQRAIIRNQSLDTLIKEVLRAPEKVNVCHVGDSIESIRAKMLHFRTEFMPVIDDDNNLVRVHFWAREFDTGNYRSKSKLDVPVVIMAGGQGTRLRPITNIIPKPLVPLGDKPIIEIIADRFQRHGVSQFYISVNYKGEMIEQYFNGIENRPYDVSYIHEEKPLGTAGSLYMLKNTIDTPFFISNCDILLNQDYSEVYEYHRENNNELTLVAALKHYRIPYGTLETGEGGLLTGIQEKPEMTYLINSGMYILEPHLLDEVPENEFFHITHLIDKIRARNGRVGVFPVSEGSWLDIGEWKEYNRTQELFEQTFHD